MENKFLINVVVPSIESDFNVYIPNNKKLGTIKKYILSSIKELSNGYFNEEIDKVIFLDRDTGKELPNDIYANDYDIKNGSKIVIIK